MKMNRKTVQKHLVTTLSASLLAFLTIQARAEVWGVKSGDTDFTEYTNALFHFPESGGPIQVVGQITMGGTNIAVDGLAMSTNGTLFGFQLDLDNVNARLVSISKTNAVATPVGPWLTGIQIRGAAVTLSGQLLALSPGSPSYVYEVNTASGKLTKTNGPLSIDLEDYCDIAQRPDGVLVVVNGRTDGTGTDFYSLNIASGSLTLDYSDVSDAPDGNKTISPGAAFSKYSADPYSLFVFDANGDEDIFTYATTSNFVRSMLHPDIISDFNSGPGDLAAEPPGGIIIIQRCVQLCWYTVTNVSYQLQYSTALDPANWYPLGAVVTGSDSIFCTNDVIPQGQPQRFYRYVVP